MTEKQGLCGTLSEASHPRGLKWLSMWENAKSRPTEQAPKGGMRWENRKKRPFFIPHIAAKIGVNVGIVLLNGRIHNKRVPQRKAALVKTAESRARQSVGALFCLQNGGHAGKVEGKTRKTRPAKMACPDARPERCERVRVT